MKLSFVTSDPTSLKETIIKLIEDGKLQTWTIHNESGEKYLKHTQQWGDKGVILLTPNTASKTLKVEVLKFTKVDADVKDFEGYYLGRFCEIVFVNCVSKFASIDKI